MAIIFNLTCNKEIKFRLRYIRPETKTIGKILSVGIPSTVMMAIGSVMNFGMNQIFLAFDMIGEIASGVFGVYFKLQSFFLMPLFGINNASISIIAFNYGARQPKRITKNLKCALPELPEALYLRAFRAAGAGVFDFVFKNGIGNRNSH